MTAFRRINLCCGSTLFALTFTTTQDSPNMRSLLSESVSADVLLEIARYLSPIDILHLGLTSSAIYYQVIGALYNVVALERADRCYITLNMLYNHPEIARHVRKLTLKPDVTSSRFTRNKYSPVDAHLVTRALKRAVPRLDALNTFVWAGEEYPPEDDIWWALQASCPQLKSIGVSFGSVLPSIKSHLFDFHDLHEFSINFESGFHCHMLFESSPETEPVFKRLWDMLINRCPGLSNLSITTQGLNSAGPVDAHRLWHGRWPKLRRLQLGNINVAWKSNASGDKTPFVTFLNEHQSLESLHLTGQFEVPSEHLAELTSISLPKLTDFTGSITHLQALPHTWSLKSIKIPDPLVVRELTPMTISNILQSTASLASLEICFILQSGYDSVSVLRSIISSCPQLCHLDLTCCRKPSFSLEEFARALRSLPRLRTFKLSLVKTSGDESMCEGAARIARTNPRLHEFSITYIHQDRVNEKGEFELMCDRHGLPVSLFTRQWRCRLWGASSRSHLCDLRPLGHPELARRGWAELLLDKGQAGKDLRMLAFSLVLVLVTAWAVI